MKYNYKKEKKIITWFYRENPNGNFGFIDSFLNENWKNEYKEKQKWYYVFNFNKKNALDWDEVEAKVKVFKGREEAVILKVLKRSEKKIIWEFHLSKNKNFGFVIVNNLSIKKDIFIAWKYIWNIKTWDIVSVQILKWAGKNPEWKIIDYIWKKDERGIGIKSYILEAWFKKEFSKKILEELKKFISFYNLKWIKWDLIKQIFKKEEYKKRRDLRKLFTFTIDSFDAKDLDDAISILQKENWDYRLFVHIADVTHYVKENSLLDKEAIKRGTSVYLPWDVLPMLPNILSNHLCSLNPWEDKLTLTCEMIVWKDWELKKYSIYESIIKSDFRLTYKEVDEIISWKINVWYVLTFKKELDEKLIKTIKNANNLKKILYKYKYFKGMLNFNFPEIKIEVLNNFKIKNIWKYPKYDSNKLIEEFMVLANEAVSRKFTDSPFLYRIHEKPKEDDIEKLQNILNLYNIKFKFKNFTTKEFSDLLEIVSNNLNLDSKIFLENNILRTLSKAIYSDKNEWHFWLWLKYYSHFTSPIRRYPDLQIHRIIKEKLSWKLTQNKIIHYKNILKEVANISSLQERKAEKLEYKVRDFYITEYYKDKIGIQCNAIIINFIPIWFFVQLDNLVEWFIEKTSFITFDERLWIIKNKKTNTIYRLWSKIKIELKNIDKERLRLIFNIL